MVGQAWRQVQFLQSLRKRPQFLYGNMSDPLRMTYNTKRKLMWSFPRKSGWKDLLLDHIAPFFLQTQDNYFTPQIVSDGACCVFWCYVLRKPIVKVTKTMMRRSKSAQGKSNVAKMRSIMTEATEVLKRQHQRQIVECPLTYTALDIQTLTTDILEQNSEEKCKRAIMWAKQQSFFAQLMRQQHAMHQQLIPMAQDAIERVLKVQRGVVYAKDAIAKTYELNLVTERQILQHFCQSKALLQNTRTFLQSPWVLDACELQLEDLHNKLLQPFGIALQLLKQVGVLVEAIEEEEESEVQSSSDAQPIPKRGRLSSSSSGSSEDDTDLKAKREAKRQKLETK